MPPSSLVRMATRACIKNLRSITDVGEAPYQIVRAILLRIENPQQLRQIELASPQICGPDGEIWLEFIKRDVPNWDKKPYEPENPKKWYKTYKKLVIDSQKEVEDDAAYLKATLDKIKQDQAQHKAQQVELKGVKVPESMKSNGPLISLSVMPKFIDRGTLPPPGDRERKTEKDPDAEPVVRTVSRKGKLDQFRKQAKAMGHFQKARRPGIWSPKDMMATPIVTAPRILIERHRKAAAPSVLDPSIKPPTVFSPKRKRVEHDQTSQPGVMTNEEREKRLKAFTNPSSVSKTTPKQEVSTSPVSHSQAVPAQRKVEPPSAIGPDFAKPPVPKPGATANLSPPPKRQDRTSPPSGHGIPRANGSSPAMRLKTRAPADIFMPAKRRKIT